MVDKVQHQQPANKDKPSINKIASGETLLLDKLDILQKVDLKPKKGALVWKTQGAWHYLNTDYKSQTTIQNLSIWAHSDRYLPRIITEATEFHKHLYGKNNYQLSSSWQLVSPQTNNNLKNL